MAIHRKKTPYHKKKSSRINKKSHKHTRKVHKKKSKQSKVNKRKNTRKTKQSRRMRKQRGGRVVHPLTFSAYGQHPDIHGPNGTIENTDSLSPIEVAQMNATQKGGFIRGILPQAVVDLGDMAQNSVVRTYNDYTGHNNADNLYASALKQPALEKSADYNIEPNDISSKLLSSEHTAAAYSNVNETGN